MKPELQFILAKAQMCVEYRRSIIFFKSSLTSCNGGQYFNDFFGPGQQKDYSFAVFFSKPVFLPDRITMESNRIKAIFTIADKKETNQDDYSSYAHENFGKAFWEIVQQQLKGAGFLEQYMEGLSVEPIRNRCKLAVSNIKVNSVVVLH